MSTRPEDFTRATDTEHLAAIAGERCAICGAQPGAECSYGASARYGCGRGDTFPGKAHSRRIRRHLERLDARYADVVRTREAMHAASQALTEMSDARVGGPLWDDPEHRALRRARDLAVDAYCDACAAIEVQP